MKTVEQPCLSVRNEYKSSLPFVTDVWELRAWAALLCCVESRVRSVGDTLWVRVSVCEWELTELSGFNLSKSGLWIFLRYVCCHICSWHNKFLDCALVITVNLLLTTGALVLSLKNLNYLVLDKKNGENLFFFVSSNLNIFFIWQHIGSSLFYLKPTAVKINSPADWNALFLMWKWSLPTFLFKGSLKPFKILFCNWYCQDCLSESNYTDDLVERNLLQNLDVGMKDNT